MPDVPALLVPVSRLDSRLKAAMLFGASFLTQYFPPWALPLWLAVLACLFLRREMRAAEALAMLRGAAVFAAAWFAMLFPCLAWQYSGDVAAASAAALPMAGRLLAWAVLGMAFARFSPPIETGRAAAWFLRPFLGGRAWRAGLALALVAWFLPATLHLVGDVNAAIRARRLSLPWRRRVFLVAGTALRLMEKKAWELALGLASRRLDQDRAWTMPST